MPSITVLSRGPLVMLGAMPAGEDSEASERQPPRGAHSQRARCSSWCGSHFGEGYRCPDGAPALGRGVEDPQKLPLPPALGKHPGNTSSHTASTLKPPHGETEDTPPPSYDEVNGFSPH